MTTSLPGIRGLVHASLWPQDRSLRVFRQWFDIEHFDLIEDVGRGPIEDDE